MKFDFERGNSPVFEVNPITDYIVDNSVCIMLYYRDCTKGQWSPDDIVSDDIPADYIIISRQLFDRLLKVGFIEFVQPSKYDDSIIYYRFTPKTHFTIELAKMPDVS